AKEHAPTVANSPTSTRGASAALEAISAPRCKMPKPELRPPGDTWEWDGIAWTSLSTSEVPSQRHHHVMAYDTARGAAITFGGDDGTPLGLHDTWFLRYDDPETPAEACQAAIDSDRDGRAGCDDPDCTAFCARCGDGICEGPETRQLCPADCEPQ
ncbi:MAG: hypothetical protein ACREBE_15090, partial [bacterium]